MTEILSFQVGSIFSSMEEARAAARKWLIDRGESAQRAPRSNKQVTHWYCLDDCEFHLFIGKKKGIVLFYF